MKNLSSRLYIIRTAGLTVLLILITTLVSPEFLSRVGAQDEDVTDETSDMLAYVSEEGHLMLYDPRQRTETLLLEDVNGFKMGRDGQIAFTRQNEDDLDLYTFDPSTPDLPPVVISENPEVIHYPLAWSPDGRYLAFGSYQDRDDQSLYVWDGETALNIMPDDQLDTASGFYIDWSHDGRLAFTVQHGWSNLDVPPEIYVWDKNKTFNLSQNLEGWDSAAIWSITGQLMFASQDDEESTIYVWDGTSFIDGIPDTDTFIHVAPDLQHAYPIWLDTSVIGFTVCQECSPTGIKEIVLWSVESKAIVKRFPITSDNAWSWLAEGGQVVLSSHLASGSPSYYLDVENIAGQILFSTETGEFSWSPDGYLAYCKRDLAREIGWILSLWDGSETWDIVRSNYRPVQWKNGRDTFSCNNG